MKRLARRTLAVATGLAISFVMSTSSALPAVPRSPTGVGRMALNDPQPGADGVGDGYFPQAGNGGYNVAHYTLDLAYDPPTRRLTATATITAHATQDLSRFDLDYRGPAISTVTVDGQPAAFSRSGQELRITPRRWLPRGQAFCVQVRYAGIPKPLDSPDLGQDGWIPTQDGAVALDEPDGAPTWFPVNDHPTDPATYTVQVTVPRGLTALSNGDLAATRASGRHVTYVWQAREPMASYLATVVIGRFAIQRGRTASGVPVLDAVAPAYATKAPYLLRTTIAAIDWEEKTFGRYPFTSAGGIRIGADLGYSLENQTRPVYAFDPDTLTVVHELAHQWFGDSVRLGRWQDIWLNEGFATYAEWLYTEQHSGPTGQRWFDHYYAQPADAQVWSPLPGDPGPKQMFTPSVYVRGAMTLHALRRTVGDAAFFQILRRWAAQQRGAAVTTPQFVALAEQVSGKDLNGLFRSWLSTPGKPPRP